MVGNGFLHGWKDIAAFLHVSVRTAQRWERESGLPVRRIQARRGHSAFAAEADLRAWLEAAPPRERSPRPPSASRARPAPVRSPGTGPVAPSRPTIWRMVTHAFRTAARTALVAIALR